MKKLLTTFALAGMIGMVGCEGTQEEDVILDDPVLEEPTAPPVVTEPVTPPLGADTTMMDSMPGMDTTAVEPM